MLIPPAANHNVIHEEQYESSPVFGKNTMGNINEYHNSNTLNGNNKQYPTQKLHTLTKINISFMGENASTQNLLSGGGVVTGGSPSNDQ